MVKNNGVKDKKDSQTGSDPAGACTAEAQTSDVGAPGELCPNG
uniref:Uncharacterized protein n=1 Tax=Knipowitschia caucasica TaxID=637954 RepID=A0AAV2LG15_KNICA